jgi:hypothetical protein
VTTPRLISLKPSWPVILLEMDAVMEMPLKSVSVPVPVATEIDAYGTWQKLPRSLPPARGLIRPPHPTPPTSPLGWKGSRIRLPTRKAMVSIRLSQLSAGSLGTIQGNRRCTHCFPRSQGVGYTPFLTYPAVRGGGSWAGSCVACPAPLVGFSQCLAWKWRMLLGPSKRLEQGQCWRRSTEEKPLRTT